MPEKRERKTDSGVHIDLGFGDLFKGLGSFLDVVSDLVEKAEEIKEMQGEFVAGKTASGEPIRGVYGFSIRTATGGMPKVESFGNIRETAKGPVVDETREPLVDVFDENGAVLVVVELPGVAEGEIQVTVEDDILSLKTTGRRRYAKEILLPSAVDPATLTKTYTNGVLEVRAKKAAGNQG
jgi:HSP20 family protein